MDSGGVREKGTMRRNGETTRGNESWDGGRKDALTGGRVFAITFYLRKDFVRHVSCIKDVNG